MKRIKDNLPILFFAYFFIYFPWFKYLEKNVIDFYPMNSRIDDLIPFCKYFIVPYVLWFFYVAFAYVFFYFKDIKLFIKMATFLTVGMSTILFICTIFPNGLIDFRPTLTLNEDIFDYLISFLHKSDTSTNVFPSIHVYNSIGVNIAIQQYYGFKNNKIIKMASHVLCVSICLSTIFLKQHAIIDVLGSLVLAYIFYNFTFKFKYLIKKRATIH